MRIAYGLGITGLDEVDALQASPVGSEPAVVVAVEQTTTAAPSLVDLQDGVLHALPQGRAVVLRRDARTARFHGPPLSPDVIAHPFLTVVGIRFNRWMGRECFHAGSFAASGRSWLVFGRSSAGKSTLLAALAGAGWGVMADDLAVTDGRVAFSGPRSIDLRQPLPELLLPTTVVRSRSRLRAALPPVADALPIGGLFFLGWADDENAEPVVRPVPPATLLPRLARDRRLSSLPTDPLMLLEIAGLPAWDLIRPRTWAALPDTVATIAETVATAAPRRMVAAGGW